MDKVIRKKVLVYCVNEGRLLVFRHADLSPEQAGIQVPGGSIRAGEAPRVEAMRELSEETGSAAFRIEEFLDLAHYDMMPHRRELQERYFFSACMAAPFPERWLSQEEHDGCGVPTRFECFWLPLEKAHILESGQGALLWRLAE
jgi:ADP-ribose pyrophosphatase YjhB (NUDIX family)